MKNLIKKWWFWLIVVIVIIIISMCIKNYIENKEIERKFEKMAEGFSDFYQETQKKEEFTNDYINNYTWKEKYNLIQEGMTLEEVTKILGKGYIAPVVDEITYFMNWGEKEGLEKGQIITIQFNNDIVYLKTQIGL